MIWSQAYAAEAKAAMSAEAAKRIAESVDPEEEERLKATSLLTVLHSEQMVPALLSRLGDVRAALDGHGGGIAVTSVAWADDGTEDIGPRLGPHRCLPFMRRCPRHTRGRQKRPRRRSRGHEGSIDKALLDTFDDLGREFILVHGKVEFV